MAIVLVHLKIKDYASWKNGFDAAAESRKAGGLTNTQIFRSTDDPNEVFVQSDIDDVAKAKQFMTSAEVKSAMEKSGIVGAPGIHFLNLA